jgi:hypothetical protein
MGLLITISNPFDFKHGTFAIQSSNEITAAPGKHTTTNICRQYPSQENPTTYQLAQHLELHS